MRAMLTLAASGLLLVAISDLAGAQNPVAPPPVVYGGHIPGGGNPPPGDSLKNPNKADPKAAENGGKLFAAFNCDGCHAGGAVGFVGPSLAGGAMEARMARSTLRSSTGGHGECPPGAARCHPTPSGSW